MLIQPAELLLGRAPLGVKLGDAGDGGSGGWGGPGNGSPIGPGVSSQLTSGPGLGRPFLYLDGQGPHGAGSADGRIMGGYVHGLFASGAFRRAFLEGLGARSDGLDHDARVDQALDEIAAALAACLDIPRIARIAGLEPAFA